MRNEMNLRGIECKSSPLKLSFLLFPPLLGDSERANYAKMLIHILLVIKTCVSFPFPLFYVSLDVFRFLSLLLHEKSSHLEVEKESDGGGEGDERE